MTLLKILSPADYVTIGSGAIGALGILYFTDGGETNLMIGAALIFIAMFLDGLDGMVARKFGSKHNVGVYLDSMSDSVSFCFAPAVFVYRMFYDIHRGSAFEDIDNFLAVATSISIATFGIVRLSIFSYFKEDELKTFLGLPTPSMAFFVLIGGLLFQDHGRILLPIIMVIVVMMVLNYPYPKIRGKLLGIPLMGLFPALIGIAMGIWDVPHYNILLAFSFIMILLYIISPLVLKIRDTNGIAGGKLVENDKDSQIEDDVDEKKMKSDLEKDVSDKD